MGEMFKTLPNLVEFKISYTTIKLIPKDSFKKSSKMIKLDLSNNKIHHIQRESLSNLSSLIELNLNNNQISTLESYHFSNLYQLQTLDLSNNQINEIDNKILGNLAKLRVLKLNGNNIHSLKENAISKELVNLHFLNLSHCGLNNLNVEFLNKMPNLKTLDLSRNTISNLNENHFKNSTNLAMVNLSSNQFNSIEDAVFQSLRLDYLDLSSNELKNVSRFAFKDLNCKNLKLSNNFNLNIDQLRTSLDNLANVENLDLSFTNTRDNDLLYEPFKQQAYNLKRLNLSNNLLTHLPRRMPDFRMIKELDFSNNQIKSLNQVQISIPDFFNKLNTHQTYVYLQGNPFTCFKCDLDALLAFVQFNRKCLDDSYYCIRCYEPTDLYGYEIRNLNATDLDSCNLPVYLSRLYRTVKSDFSYIIIIVVVAVILLIFAFLLIIYHQKIYRSIFQTGQYYTREPKNGILIDSDNNDLYKSGSSGETSNKTLVEQQQLTSIKQNGHLSNHHQKMNVYKIDLPQELPVNKLRDINLKENSNLHRNLSILSHNINVIDSNSNNNGTKFNKLSPDSLYNVSEHSNYISIYKEKQNNQQQVNLADVQNNVGDHVKDEEECSEPFLV